MKREKKVREAMLGEIYRLWEEERYEDILPLAGELPPGSPGAAGLLARLYFHLAMKSPLYVSDLRLYWFTAVFHSGIFSAFGKKGADPSRVREILLKEGREVIRKQADSGGRELLLWDLEHEVTETLGRLGVKSLFSPAFARRFNRCGEVVKELRDKADRFENREDYLKTGGFFSPAGEMFSLARIKDYRGALALLPKKYGRGHSEFMEYALQRTCFELGLYYMETGEGSLRHFNKCGPLFDLSSCYSDEMIKKGVKAGDPVQLGRYEKGLGLVRKNGEEAKITRALSLVMARRGLMLRREKKITAKALEGVLKRAVKLHPGNLMAVSALGRVGKELKRKKTKKGKGKKGRKKR